MACSASSHSEDLSSSTASSNATESRRGKQASGPVRDKSIIRDESRLQALRRYDILDTEPEPAFDRITRLAAHLFDAPTALVNFVAEDRQWFKSTVGFDDEETGLDVSLCVYTVEKGDVFVVQDLSADERFSENPYVTDHGVRFYAGAPLITPDDHRLGTLCVLDTEPRSPSAAALDRLSDLAAMVVDELELRKETAEHQHARRELEQSEDLLRHAQELAEVGGWTYDPQADELTWTDQTYRIHDLPLGAEMNVDDALGFYTEASRSVLESHFERLIEEGGRYDLELSIETAQGKRRRIRTIGEAQRENGETTQIVGAIQDITEQHRDRRLKDAQSAFFERIATGEAPGAILDDIAQFTEAELPDASVSILRLDDDRLFHAAGPSLPDAYVEAIDGVEIGPDVGTCGAASYRKEDVVTDDIRADDRWDDFRAAAEQAGFRACNSQVIQGSEGTVFGTFAIYREEPGAPTPAEQQLVRRMSHVASVALERDWREQRLRMLSEAVRQANEAVLITEAEPIDEPGPRIVYTNEAFEEMTGYAEAEVLGKTPRILQGPETDRAVLDEIREALDAGETWEGESINYRKDDTPYWVQWNLAPVEEEDGEIEYWVSVQRDVTERRERERRLRMLSEAVRQAKEAVVITEAESLDEPGPRIVYVNEAFEEMTGYAEDEILGKTPRILQGPETERAVLDGLRAALEAGETWEGETINYRKDGTPYHQEWNLAPVKGQTGEIEYWVSVQRDVTEERVREATLRRQKNLLEQTQRLAGAWEVDLRTEEVRASEETRRIYERDPDAAALDLGDGFDFTVPEAQSAFREAFDQCVEEGLPYDLELPVETAKGNRRWIRAVGAPAETENGEVVKVAGAVQDITKRKQAEEDLREREARIRGFANSIPGVAYQFYAGPEGDWGVRFVSEYAEEVLGISIDPEGFYEWFVEHVPASHREALKESVAQAFEDEIPWQFDFPFETPSGERIWVLGTSTPTKRGEELVYNGVLLDITERKKAERELQRSRKRYRALFRDAGDAILVHDLDGVIQEANPQAEALFGIPATELQGRSLAELYVSSEAETAQAKLKALRDGRPFEAVSRYERTDGSVFWGELSASTVQINGETVARTLIRDVTDRVETRRELVGYREYTDRLLDAIDDLFFAIDEDGQFRRWNDRVPAVTGYTDAEIEEMTAFDLVPESEHERVAAAIAEALETGHAQIEAPLLCKNEATIPYEFVGSLVEHPDGGLRAVCIGRDVTERRRRKRKLERLNDLFAKAEDLARVGAWEYDVQADEGILTDEVYRIHGLSPEAALSMRRSLVYYHPDDRSRIREAFRRATEEGESYDLELRLITEDGDKQWVRTRGEPQREDGEIMRVRGTIQDVTEQVRRRAELKEAKEAAEEADRIKTALLSNMNHELRTPLTSIITFSELIRDNPDIAGRFADRILGGGKRLLYTLNTVMDFAELEGGDRSGTPKPFPLGDVVWSVTNDFRQKARQKEVDLSVDVPESGRTVTLDQYGVERILTHLVHNAVKFTDEGEVTVSVQMRDERVELLVEDTGVGIAPDFLPQVYDEFAQASTGNDRMHEGNGIGLTVVKRLVEAMSGTVDVESEPGEGTTVTVRLPIR